MLGLSLINVSKNVPEWKLLHRYSQKSHMRYSYECGTRIGTKHGYGNVSVNIHKDVKLGNLT